ncbi:MAG: hypothetical protein GX951_04480 [Mollicutes bacterium]|nr:hypothetical protein [Mollicutes bacterium]
MENKVYYPIMNKASLSDISYHKDMIKEILKLNPNVKMGLCWIEKCGIRKLTITSSDQVEKLQLPEKLFGIAISTKSCLNSEEEYLQYSRNFLNFTISLESAKKFITNLKMLNPDVDINFEYNEKSKSCKITSSIPLNDICFPSKQEGNNIIIDQKGCLAQIYGIMHECEIKYDALNKTYDENIQKIFYFDTVLFNKLKKEYLILKAEEKTLKESIKKDVIGIGITFLGLVINYINLYSKSKYGSFALKISDILEKERNLITFLLKIGCSASIIKYYIDSIRLMLVHIKKRKIEKGADGNVRTRKSPNLE